MNIYWNFNFPPIVFNMCIEMAKKNVYLLACVVHLIFVINFSLKTLHTVFVNVRGSLMWYKKKKIFAQRFRWLCEYVSQPGVPSFVYALYTYNRLNAVLYSAESDSPLWKSEKNKKKFSKHCFVTVKNGNTKKILKFTIKRSYDIQKKYGNPRVRKLRVMDNTGCPMIRPQCSMKLYGLYELLYKCILCS